MSTYLLYEILARRFVYTCQQNPPSLVGQALHLPPGHDSLGHIKPANHDQKDGNTFGDGLYIAASIAAGGAKSATGVAVGKAASSGSLLSRFINFLKGGKCFVAGTPVQMADGTFKFIEAIQEKDQVVSRDPVTGKTKVKRVVRTFKHTAYEIAILELIDQTTGQVVECLHGTPLHPFFTPSGMVAMGDLKPGMQVSSRRGPPLVVKAVKVEKHPEGVAVYNFEVADDHTYFVGKAQGGAWVHNDCASGFTRVGRWMSEAEYNSMVAQGRVQPTLAGLEMKSVTNPPNPDAFLAAAKGSVFAEFDVPTSQLRQGGKSVWSTVFGPNSILGRLEARRGNPVTAMPEVRNIVIRARN